jgi:hypothetical protein
MISSRFDDESFLTDMDQQISKLKCQSSKQRLDSRLHTNNNDTGVKAFCHLNFDGPVKSPQSRHPGESRGPEVLGIPGFRLPPE